MKKEGWEDKEAIKWYSLGYIQAKEIIIRDDFNKKVAELLNKIVDEFMFDGSEKLMLGRIASEVFGSEKPSKDNGNSNSSVSVVGSQDREKEKEEKE